MRRTLRRLSAIASKPLVRMRPLSFVLLALIVLSSTMMAAGGSVFGPRLYRGTGRPELKRTTFVVTDSAGPFTLRVVNSGMTVVLVALNHQLVVRPGDFKKAEPSGKLSWQDFREPLFPQHWEPEWEKFTRDHRKGFHPGDSENPPQTVVQRPVNLRQGVNEVIVGFFGKRATSFTVEILRATPPATDTTPPAITTSVTPSPNANGWHSGPATVSFACSDAGSGVAGCPPSVTVSTEGLAQVVSGTATDNAGNAASASVTLNVDLTAPVVSAAPSPAANANGWNDSDVVVTFTATDNLSGISPGSVTAPITLAVDGTNLSASGQATDLAGHVGMVTYSDVNIDRVPPVIDVTLSPEPESPGFYTAPVTAHFTCSDLASGIATCPPDEVVSTEGAGQTVSGTATDLAGNSASVTSAPFTIDLGLPSDEEEPESAGVLSLAGASQSAFNAVGANVTFSVAGAFFGDSVTLFRNGLPVPVESLILGTEEVTAPSLLVEGRNSLIFLATDTAGQPMYEDFTLWAGSQELSGIVLDEHSLPALGVSVKAQLGDDSNVTQTVTSGIDGTFTFVNVPLRTINLTALASSNRSAARPAFGGDGFVLLQLRVIDPPSPIDNNDFSLGTDGWNIGTAPVQLVEHVETLSSVSADQALNGLVAAAAPNVDLLLNTSGEGPQTISRTFTVAPGTLNITARYRFITSEVPGGYFGTQFNDSFNVTLRSLTAGEVRNETHSMNELGLGAFDASGATDWRETSLPVSVSGDTIQVDMTVANVADGLYDSQLLVDLLSEKTLKIKTFTLRDIDNSTLTHLSTDAHTYFGSNTRIHGTITIEGAEDDGLASLVLEVVQGGGVVATAELSATAQTALLKPFGAAKKVEITSSQLLFELPAAAASAVNGTADGTVSLRFHATSTNGEDVIHDASVVQILVKYDGTNRYGGRDAGVGGDDWARPSLEALVSSFPGLVWGDFSNMNGGPFPPHGSHRTGLDVDGWFDGYNALNAATAQEIINHLNTAGTNITLVLVAYTENDDSDPFWVAIKNVTLGDGRKAKAVIRPDGSHDTHFHWRKPE